MLYFHFINLILFNPLTTDVCYVLSEMAVIKGLRTSSFSSLFHFSTMTVGGYRW